MGKVTDSEAQLRQELERLRRRVKELESAQGGLREDPGSLAGGGPRLVAAVDPALNGERLFRTCVMAAPIGIGLVKNRVFQWVNHYLQDLLQYVEDELRGQSARMLYESDEEFERVGRIKYEQIERTGFGQVETRIRRKDGMLIDGLLSSAALDPNDIGAGTIFTFMDISGRKKAEQALAESERRYKLATASGNMAVWDWWPAEDYFYIDGTFFSRLNYSPTESGRDIEYWISLTHPEDTPVVQSIYERLIAGYEDEFEVRYRVKAAEGHYCWFETRGHAHRDKTGAVERIIGTTTDITERQNMEAALREQEMQHQMQLMHADRLVTVGRLAAGVAHEINNPLSVLYGSLQELLREGETKVTLEPATVDRMLRTARRIKDIVHNLLVFSRQKSTQKLDININEVIENTLSHVRSHATKHGIDIETELAENLPPVKINLEQMQQVILNLVFNAFDAMTKGGRLQIHTALKEHCICIRVIDDGQGIPADIAGDIFAPFFTTKEVGRGTGLGLSISYGIIQDHSGTIRLKSSPGKGAEFIISLPRTDTNAPPCGD